MHRTGYLLLVFILLISLSFRLVINYFIPITQQINLPLIFMGVANLVLVFIIIRRLVNFRVGLLTSLLYAISPWTAYLEISGSFYIFLLWWLLILTAILISISNKKIFFLAISIFILFSFIKNPPTIFSDVGLLNSVNTFQGETRNAGFGLLGRLVENRYIYFGEHLIFHILKQFTPATYFTNQSTMLGFSFTPPIFLGFIIPFVLALFMKIKNLSKNDIYKTAVIALLFLPSILHKDSPHLPSLVLASPIIFYMISCGIYEFVTNYKRPNHKFLFFLTIFLVTLQFLVTLIDIAVREPVRMQ